MPVITRGGGAIRTARLQSDVSRNAIWARCVRERVSVVHDLDMAEAVRVSLPADVAQVLLDEHVAVRPVVTRGGGLGEVISLVVEGVNTGANVVTLVTASAAMVRLARALRERLGRGVEGERSVRVRISGPQGECSLVIDETTPPEVAGERLRAALQGVRAGQPA
jgi:hypothetical protein